MTLLALANDNEPETIPYHEPSKAAIVADILTLRPLGFIGTILGSVAFVISLPVTLPSDSYKEVGETIVMKPAYFTFNRPLGKM